MLQDLQVELWGPYTWRNWGCFTLLMRVITFITDSGPPCTVCGQFTCVIVIFPQNLIPPKYIHLQLRLSYIRFTVFQNVPSNFNTTPQDCKQVTSILLWQLNVHPIDLDLKFRIRDSQRKGTQNTMKTVVFKDTSTCLEDFHRH